MEAGKDGGAPIPDLKSKVVKGVGYHRDRMKHGRRENDVSLAVANHDWHGLRMAGTGTGLQHCC